MEIKKSIFPDTDEFWNDWFEKEAEGLKRCDKLESVQARYSTQFGRIQTIIYKLEEDEELNQEQIVKLQAEATLLWNARLACFGMPDEQLEELYHGLRF